MVSKWAQGTQPRGFRWVIADRLAVCERPGGYGVNHRRVRRLEEVIWLSRNDIDTIVTLTAAPYNLSDYDAHDLHYIHIPFVISRDGPQRLRIVFDTIRNRLAGQRVLLHRESVGEQLAGVVAGYLLWAGLVQDGHIAVSITERLLGRQLGPTARTIVSIAVELRSADERSEGDA